MVFISITSGEFNPCGDLTDNPTDKIHYLSVTRRDAKPKLAISVVSHDAPLLHFKVGFSQNRLFVRLFHFLLTIGDQWEENDRYISGISDMIWPGYQTERHISVTFIVMMMLWYISYRKNLRKNLRPKLKFCLHTDSLKIFQISLTFFPWLIFLWHILRNLLFVSFSPE